MFIVLLGAPGSGKGTTSEILTKDLNLVHISTGDLCRENMKNNTEIGIKIKEYMDEGKLVPDDIAIEMLVERLKEPDVANGAILDGFPRTRYQAEKLKGILAEKGQKVNVALNIEISFEEIIERIANRRNCSKCNKIYNLLYNPPKIEGICDVCGEKLYQRDDQRPEVFQTRLDIYSATAEEIKEFYKEEGLLYTVVVGKQTGKGTDEVVKEVKEYLAK